MKMVGGNGGNQFRQYVGLNIGNQTGYNTVQNVRNQVVQNSVQNLGIQNDGNQNGLIVVSEIANHNANQNVNQNGNVLDMSKRLGHPETDIHKRTENKAKNDKTGHGMEKCEKTKPNRSQKVKKSKSKSKSKSKKKST
ncbi:hypothetical protein Tco_0961808 [Tanacetum coccineum]